MSCGCNDSPLPLSNCNPCAGCAPANATSLPPCANGEPCEEIVTSDCTQYVGPNLPALGVLNGDRLLTVLTKLHKLANSLIQTPIVYTNFTVTATTAVPFIVNYLGLGPVYTSTAGATSSNTTITVGSTTGLAVGMVVSVKSGTGAFAANTTVTAIQGTTQFVVNTPPTTALSGGQTIITAHGSTHTPFTVTVLQNAPQTIGAFVGSPVIVSGTGTIV